MMLLDVVTGYRLFSLPDGSGEPFEDHTSEATPWSRAPSAGPDRPCEPCDVDYAREARRRRKLREERRERERARANAGWTARHTFSQPLGVMIRYYKEL